MNTRLPTQSGGSRGLGRPASRDESPRAVQAVLLQTGRFGTSRLRVGGGRGGGKPRRPPDGAEVSGAGWRVALIGRAAGSAQPFCYSRW